MHALADALTNGYVSALRVDFEGEHRRRYGFDLESPIEIATLRVVGRGVTPDLPRAPGRADEVALADAVDRHEAAVFDGEPMSTPIYDRERLCTGHRIDGPAIVVQDDSTAVIEPDSPAPLTSTPTSSSAQARTDERH